MAVSYKKLWKLLIDKDMKMDGDVFAVVYLKLHVRDPFIFICKGFIVDNGF